MNQLKPSQQSFPGFLIKTWAGRILVINGLFFIVTVIMSGSVMTFGMDSLWELGAQDPIGIAKGEHFRLIMPMFLHGGLIHFVFNSLAIFVVGRDLEPILGSMKFLFIYFFSGIAAGLTSTLVSSSYSVGASGAIFGLLGAGLILERLFVQYVKRETGAVIKRTPYLSMLILNIPLSFLPMIDLWAHVGGLVGGIVSSGIIICWYGTRLFLPKKALALGLMTLSLIGFSFGFEKTQDQEYVFDKIYGKYEQSDNVQEKVFYLTQCLELKKEGQLFFQRSKLLFAMKEDSYALADMQHAIINNMDAGQIDDFLQEVKSTWKSERWEKINADISNMVASMPSQ